MKTLISPSFLQKGLIVTLAFLAYQSLNSQSIAKADSLKIIIDNSNKVDTATINLSIEYLHQLVYSGKADSSLLPFAEKKLKESDKLEFTKGKVLLLQKIGILYQFYLGKPIVAIDYYQKALNLTAENPNLRKLEYSSLMNMATVYLNQQEFEEAKKRYLDILQRWPKENVELYLGNIYGELGDLDSAIYYFKLGIFNGKKSNKLLAIANGYTNLALILARNKEVDEAIKAIDTALVMVENNQFNILKPSTYLNACEVYKASNQYDLAIKYAEKSISSGYVDQNLFLQKSTYATLYESYKNIGKFKEALDAFEKYTLFNDSIKSDERKVEVSRKEMQFNFDQESAKKEAVVQQEKLRNQNMVLAIIGILLLFGFVIFFQWRQYKLKKLRREAESKREISESKLKALRAQLNPHFLFNSFNSIERFLLKHDKEQTSKVLIDFSRLMRKVLDNSDKNFIPLKEELEVAKLYLKLEQFRLENFEFVFIGLEKIDVENIMVPSLYLQPFLENSVEHGMLGQKMGLIKVQFSIIKNSFETMVSDNGYGHSQEKSNHKSKGMNITNARFKAIEKITEGEAKVERINTADKGYKVKISFPLQERF